MSGQDWAPVNAGRAGVVGAKVVAPKTAREITAAKAAGTLATEKRFGAGGNKSAHSTGTGLSLKKLEDADDVGTIAKVDKSLSIAIMQVRYDDQSMLYSRFRCCTIHYDIVRDCLLTLHS
jgi:Multiprotein bridging factor 1